MSVCLCLCVHMCVYFQGNACLSGRVISYGRAGWGVCKETACTVRIPAICQMRNTEKGKKIEEDGERNIEFLGFSSRVITIV